MVYLLPHQKAQTLTFMPAGNAFPITITDRCFLVTGGAGFIGSGIVAYLLQHGARKVRVLDNLSTGYRANLAQWDDNPRFAFVGGDVTRLDDAFDFNDADLASRSSHLRKRNHLCSQKVALTSG